MKKIISLTMVAVLFASVLISGKEAEAKYTKQEIQLAKITAKAQKKKSSMKDMYVSCVIKGKFSKYTPEMKTLSKKDQTNLKKKIKKIRYFIILADDAYDIAVTSDYKIVTYKKYTYQIMYYVNVSNGKYLSKKKTNHIDELREKYLK